MPRKPDERSVRDVFDKIRHHLADLELDAGNLLRRIEHEQIDGYPASSMGGSGGGEVSDPTASAAGARTRRQTDKVYKNSLNALELVLDAEKRLRIAANLRKSVMDIEEDTRGRVSTVSVCVACDDPLNSDSRSELCGKDRKAFARAQEAASPHVLSRDLWIQQQKQRRDNERKAS